MDTNLVEATAKLLGYRVREYKTMWASGEVFYMWWVISPNGGELYGSCIREEVSLCMPQVVLHMKDRYGIEL